MSLLPPPHGLLEIECQASWESLRPSRAAINCQRDLYNHSKWAVSLMSRHIANANYDYWWSFRVSDPFSIPNCKFFRQNTNKQTKAAGVTNHFFKPTDIRGKRQNVWFSRHENVTMENSQFLSITAISLSFVFIQLRWMILDTINKERWHKKKDHSVMHKCVALFFVQGGQMKLMKKPQKSQKMPKWFKMSTSGHILNQWKSQKVSKNANVRNKNWLKIPISSHHVFCSMHNAVNIQWPI